MGLLGDSYVVGSGLDDSETITAQLAERLSESVYNYGCSLAGAPSLY